MSDRSSHPDFVGRRDELAAFERAFAAARAETPSIVLIGGDAGIGKSTLLREAAHRAGVDLHIGRCVPIGGDVIPLAPLADLLRQVRRTLPELLDRSAALAPLARWLSPAPGDGANEQGPGGLFVPVLEMITAIAAEGVAAIGIEDLHWADAVTWDLFDFLVRNLTEVPVVLIGTYRAADVAAHPAQRRRLAELTRLPAVHRIELVGLEDTDVTARITSLLGSTPPHALVEQILTRGQGNPFFTEELVAAHLAGETIPAVLSDLISADVAGLDDPTHQVVAAMAVAGRDTTHELLRAVVDLDDDAIERSVRAAMDAQLVVVDATTDAYHFRHALIGEVIYADLLPSQRARLHRRVADVLQQQSTAQLTRADLAGALAFHLDRSGDHPGAFLALLAAADASETIAPGAAFGHLQRAFDLWDLADGTSARISRSDRLWQAAELASAAVGNERAVEIAREAARAGPHPQGEVWGHERLGRYLWASGRLEESRAEFEAAAVLLADATDPRAAGVFAGLGQAELMAGRYELAITWCDRTFATIQDPTDDPSAWSMARRVLGVARSHLGDPADGVERCREALEVAPTAQARALAVIYLCAALLDAGQNQEAVDVALDGVARGHVAGLDHSFGGYLDAEAAEGLLRLGRWSEAAATLARHVADETLPVGLMRVARAGAMLASRRGDAAEANRLLTRALVQPMDGFHQPFLDAAAADVHLCLGNWAEAAAAAERGWANRPPRAALWSARSAMYGIAAAVEQTLDALASGGSVDLPATVGRLQARIDEVKAEHHRGGQPSSAPDVVAHLAHAGAALTRLGPPDPDAWAEAAQRWDAIGDRWWVAVATLREADAAASAGDTARAASALQAAHRMARDLGAPRLAAEAESISRRTRLSLEPPSRVTIGDTSVQRLGLTAREAEVLALLAAGQTNRQIGEVLFVSEKTASVHVSNILRKLGVASRVDAAAVAQRLGVA